VLLSRGSLVVRTRVADPNALLPLVLAGAVVIGESDLHDPLVITRGDGHHHFDVDETAEDILSSLESPSSLSQGDLS
jgi:hypothetical protein